MKRIQRDISYLFLPLVLVAGVTSYPTQKNDILEMQPEMRDEKRFPNGTTIGKYMYTDNEGNPIQVKYYADDASYGVELKSIKVLDTTGEPFPTGTALQNAPNKFDSETDPSSAAGADLINTNTFPDTQAGFNYKRNELPNAYKILNKGETKSNLFRANPDYEVFYQNELAGPKCGKEKVHVYFDAKENRKMRSVANDLADADKFCEQILKK